MNKVFRHKHSKKGNWPPTGIKIRAILEHWHTKRKEEVVLLTVDEDDVSFRFEDGNELSYDYNVVEWEEI